MTQMPEMIRGNSGREYLIEKVLQDKEGLRYGRVYLAANRDEKYVLKEIPQEPEVRAGIYDRVGGHPNVRALIDTVPDRRIFVFRFLEENLLSFIQRDPPVARTKQILKHALQGLAALHDQDLVHNDIKANNIMLKVKESAAGMFIEQVQLIDLEDTVYLPSGTVIAGAQVGNYMWRSPESHAMGPIEKPSDIFSFGIVCIYAMLKDVIFAVEESELEDGKVEILSIVLERHLSYFADPESFEGFLRYLDEDNPWQEIFEVVMGGFGENHPRKPFGRWQGPKLDEDFKNLVVGLTNFDPQKRLTAQQALGHKWFEDVET